MAGNKTHDQQIRIINKEVDTSNAGPEFDPRPDLNADPQARAAIQPADLPEKRPDLTDPDDRNMIRGEHQESSHHKRGGEE